MLSNVEKKPLIMKTTRSIVLISLVVLFYLPVISQNTKVTNTEINTENKEVKSPDTRLNASVSLLGNYAYSSISFEILKPKLGFEIPMNFLYDQDLEFKGFISGLNIKLYLFNDNKWIYVGPVIHCGYLYDNAQNNRLGSVVISPGVKMGVQIKLSSWFGIHVEGSSELFILLSEPATALALAASVGINFTL